jgi:hydroxyacylglutathione hydrolase
MRLFMQIASHIHVLKTPLGPEPGQFVNLFILSSDRITLIDTGIGASDKLVINYIREMGRDPSEINQIILTHRHPDHMGAARAIHDMTGCDVAAHVLERPAIEAVDPALLKVPGPGGSPLVSGPVPVTRSLNDGDNLRIDTGITLEVLHTPGHTPGSISLFYKEDKALFSGDAVAVPGRMPIYSDPVVFVRSIQRLKGIPGIRYFLPGHDKPVENEVSYNRMDAALAYVRHIDELVRKISAKAEDRLDPEAMAGQLLAELGIARTHTFPLVVQTFIGHLNAQGLDDVLDIKS